MSHNAFNSKTSLVKVIFIDWDGTLSNSRFWRHWQLHPRYHDLYRLIQTWLFHDQPQLIQDWMRGHYTAEKICEIVAKKTSVSSDFILRELIKSCQAMHLLEPTVLSTIAKLRKQGAKVVIATDNMDTFLRWTVPALNLTAHFDAVLCSYAYGRLKLDQASEPHPFFEIYPRSLGLPTSAAVLFDDSPNCQELSRIGLSVITVSPDQPLSRRLTDLENEQTVDLKPSN